MTIPDSFIFPQNHIALSPQFMPRSEGEESSTNGYILCTVSTPEQNEIWIFDAANLKEGALCKLHHPELNFGFSLHTTWLKNINTSNLEYKIEDARYYQSCLEDTLNFVDKKLPFFLWKIKNEIKEEIKHLMKKL